MTDTVIENRRHIYFHLGDSTVEQTRDLAVPGLQRQVDYLNEIDGGNRTVDASTLDRLSDEQVEHMLEGLNAEHETEETIADWVGFSAVVRRS